LLQGEKADDKAEQGTGTSDGGDEQRVKEN
jgi:hypothetical protein